MSKKLNVMPDNEFTKKLKEKYEEVIKEHGDFKSIIWDFKEKDFKVTL